MTNQLVRYETLGEGPPVVLVHGLGGSARWWRGTTASLAQDHRVIVPDLPGFGYGGGRFRLDEAPVMLAALIEGLGLARPALVGHSLGALVCLGMAVATPEAVGRLALISPPLRPASLRLTGNVIPAVRTLLGLPPSAALTVALDVATRSPAALLRAGGEILARAGAPTIDAEPVVPTLVLWGARDTLVPVGGADWVRRAMPSARVVVIPGAGHVPMFDRPEAVLGELRAFLGEA